VEGTDRDGETTEAEAPRLPSDEIVIDLTDATLAREALYERLVSTSPTGELIIDLRDSVLDKLLEVAPSGRTSSVSAMASGRPQQLEAGLRLVDIADHEADLWEQAEHFVYETYVSLGYTTENARRHVVELEPYRPVSTFHAAIDEEGAIVGTSRSLIGDYHELPIGRFRRIDFTEQDPFCELSSIVVDPAKRSQGVLEHLCRAGWANGLRNGARTLAALGERWMIDWFRKVYCMPFVAVAVPEHYMGGELIPMALAIDARGMGEVARTNPEFWWFNLELLTDEEIDRFGFRPLTRASLAGSGAGGVDLSG
jgi:hypothetical protein